mmetsp:Transcript_20747/g.58210  ORF Transcript_20747/g.58210 Transcript_20747/m.58210 type:complete len:213 (-) Transcript_20747:2107-2745(-)
MPDGSVDICLVGARTMLDSSMTSGWGDSCRAVLWRQPSATSPFLDWFCRNLCWIFVTAVFWAKSLPEESFRSSICIWVFSRLGNIRSELSSSLSASSVSSGAAVKRRTCLHALKNVTSLLSLMLICSDLTSFIFICEGHSMSACVSRGAMSTLPFCPFSYSPSRTFMARSVSLMKSITFSTCIEPVLFWSYLFHTRAQRSMSSPAPFCFPSS